MYRSILVVTLLGAGLVGANRQRSLRPALTLGEGRMTLEYTVGEGAVVRVEAESEEELEHVRVRRPDGELLLGLDGSTHGLSGLVIEQRVTSYAELLADYSEGDYEIRASARDGTLAIGKARFSFALPRAPRIVFPPPGANDVASSNLTVSWLPEPGVVAYHVQLEQGESDGLAVSLPPGQGSFRVPDGFLARGTATRLEVAAVAPNGNTTLVEVPFTTSP